MRLFSLILVSLLVLSVYGHGEHGGGKYDPIRGEVTPEQFDQLMMTSDNVFLKMYTKTCGHCRKMRQDWVKMEEHFKDSHLIIASMDCALYKDKCTELGAKGYPSLRYWNSEHHEKQGLPYLGPRKFNRMHPFAEENLLVKCNIKHPFTCTHDGQKYITAQKDNWHQWNILLIGAKSRIAEHEDGTKEMAESVVFMWEERVEILNQLSKQRAVAQKAEAAKSLHDEL